MALATSFAVLNYSGMLFNKGNTRTPFSSAIGAKAKITDHVEFACGQEYTSGGGAQPAISENASLTAPATSFVTRTQNTNVTQIFHESLGVSYAKMSNMGTLSGINIANQTANPMSELDFQVAARMQKVNADIEYTFINGTYVKAASDATANQTRGILEAITTNTSDLSGAAIDFYAIESLLGSIYNANAPTQDLVLVCDGVTMQQINKDAVTNKMTVFPADREVNGIRLSRIVTSFGDLYLMLGAYLPAGTAFIANFDVISPVFQPVPGKGNFFLEELAKTGAGTTYQLFGQIGLDHGPEWYHGKFTNIKTTL